ncbi:MAG TPA: helix-turn-helix domain-containing protein [Acidobacteriaceae bacterium]|nr:helix-turn-helix domain-containing protein [Acidobacteriaceae bacterium]
MVDQFSIGALAKEVGVKVVTIRYYEQIGLLPTPERTEGNYRSYNRAHAEQLQFIRRCRELGFPLDQIRDLFRLSSESAESCQEVCAIADRHLVSVETKLADLKRLASELRRISASCSGSRPMADCRIIEALSSPS